MLGPPSQHQQQQHQQYPQYHGHPPQQGQYPPGAVQHDGRSQHPQQQQQQQQSNGHSHGAEMNNPYQQYAAGYGQPQQYPQGQPQQQMPQQHQAQYGQPHQQQQQPPQQQSQQIPQGQRSYMPTPNQNQLPPLGPTMSSSSMAPAVTESHSSQAASPANPPQPPPYMTGPPQVMHQQQPLAPPAPRGSVSVSATSNTPKEKKMSSSSERGPYRYSLEVVQQPQRARMCGFGDKDRRPITPPPCVRLVIVDIETGREVPVGEIDSDPSFFLLQCDLWAESADREANVVRASSNSPAVSISSATTTSYPPPAEPAHRQLSHEQHGVYMNAQGQPVYSTVPGYTMSVNGRPGIMPGYGGMEGYPPGSGPMYYPQGAMGPQMSYMAPQNNNAMYTRNLIGSLTVNAAKLTDDAGKVGYWFVLQDLSVRTEGFFRLRMSFVDISNPTPAGGVIKGATPVLAWTFSDKFQVYSAKKFPGVIESTALSKSFASQGIKIPIRKDNKNDAQDDDDGD